MANLSHNKAAENALHDLLALRAIRRANNDNRITDEEKKAIKQIMAAGCGVPIGGYFPGRRVGVKRNSHNGK